MVHTFFISIFRAKSASQINDNHVDAHSKPGTGVVGLKTASISLFDATMY